MTISLIYPHQLFPKHPALKREAEVFLLEDPLFFGTDSEQPLRLHRKKLVLHRASMKRYAAGLKKLTYVDLPAESCRSDQLLEQVVPAKVTRIVCVDPADYLLERRIRRFCEGREIELELLESPMFVTPDDWMNETMGRMKRPFMKTFYEAQRKRMKVLMDGDQPEGGKYSFDADNRKKLPKSVEVPAAYVPPTHDEIEEAATWVESRFPDALGTVEDFEYGICRKDALEALELFLEERFSLFGDYEDAISSSHRVAFHSVLTPYLNIGLITPQEVVDRALEFAGEKENIPLNSLEGFIRQIIGWREFMRIIYLRHGVFERKENFWGFKRPMPDSFYDGTTGIEPIDHVIRGLKQSAYCHHIERLMVLGNFMMLCRIDPDDVYRWFMEFFIDAYDWVMVPNVYGMSQFADGGIFATKPYLSGSNYIRKMSDFKKGDWCETWDGLFWTFVEDHHEFFRKNYRLAQMARLHDRMSDEKKQAHRDNAERFLAKL
ncbi:cryptochrome/photolyase family protein [Haloferula sp.]|uniref:cryptochrome/photolyase family protein n=1 Tax=Haloferula sp. TaxID=2497595 RepID=UPI00329D9FEA